MVDMRDESSMGEDYDPVPEPGQPAGVEHEDPDTDSFQMEDVTPDYTPDDFSIDDFLDGARPNRRAVKLYMRVDLLATMDELAGMIDALPDDAPDARVDELVQRFNDARDGFYASGRWWVLEGRSYEWVRDQRFNVVHREFGLKVLDQEEGTISAGPRREECLAAASAELLVGQIVSPAGATREKLLRLAQVSPTEYRKLLAAQSFANNSLAENSKVLTRDFSRASSTATQGS